MAMSTNIKRLRKENGYTQKELADKLNVGLTSVSAWETGRSKPLMDKVTNMAKLFNVNVSEIVGDNLNNSFEIIPTESYVPLLGIVTAGQPLEMFENPERVQVPDEIVKTYPNSYLLEVDGDSMNKIVPDGSYVLIQKTKELNSGEVGVIAVNGTEATLKRFFKAGNNIVLQPESYNPIHSNQFYDCSKGECDEVRIIGKLVWHMAPVHYKY